ncbi:MAG: PAS domain S-box protein [Deltaproteobacteria bacterium]|nr:PAS domain S-box protein [Deltaproteobacteria bacterium]MBW1930508.1 PAS domain S-box protein [Deltaproteobacteria bacterium]MBW2127148.1 PAS domain S-box protein [Deltaproteobacteria bacterium]
MINKRAPEVTSDNPSGYSLEKGGMSDLQFYKLIIDSLPAGVLTVNADLQITGFNPWAERITGFAASEVIGRHCGEVLRGGRCMSQCPLRSVLNGHKPLSLIETTIHNKWGEQIPVRMSSAGLFDPKGRLIGGVESFHDISRIKSLEREKDNLVSMLAHDMKSSLSIIGGFALRLLSQKYGIDPEKGERYLKIIRDEAFKIETLINDFLDFSRLESGKIRPNFSSISLDRELLELVEAYQVKAAELGLTLELDTEHEIILVEADATQLRRVFSNLLDNAIKFSHSQGKIKITINQTSDKVIIEVKDEGIGIAEDDLPFIFDPFHRGLATHDKEGVGLGLAGVKSIVEAHGGQIRVDSEPGKGSVFTVHLPKTHRT